MIRVGLPEQYVGVEWEGTKDISSIGKKDQERGKYYTNPGREERPELSLVL